MINPGKDSNGILGPHTYGDLPDFDKIVKEGDEFIEQTYSMMSDLEKEEVTPNPL